MAPVNILIYGAGGVGIIYAAVLAKGGANVTAVCRSNYNAVKADGILVRSVRWGHLRARPNAVRTVQDAASHGPFDYIIVATKAFPNTALLIRDAVGPGTAIVLAQNGILIEEDYAQLYPDNTLISGVVWLPTTQVSPGIVEHSTELQRFEIGTFPARASTAAKKQVQILSDLFAAGDADAPVHDDIQIQRWVKLAVNGSLNPMTALTLCDDANYIRSSEYALDAAKDVMREIGALATAAGYPNLITAEEINEQMARHVRRLETGGKEPSMLVDIHHDRPIEVEAILGNAVRLADKLTVKTPYLKMLYVLAKARNFATLKDENWKPIATVS